MPVHLWIYSILTFLLLVCRWPCLIETSSWSMPVQLWIYSIFTFLWLVCRWSSLVETSSWSVVWSLCISTRFILPFLKDFKNAQALNPWHIMSVTLWPSQTTLRHILHKSKVRHLQVGLLKNWGEKKELLCHMWIQHATSPSFTSYAWESHFCFSQ